MKKILTSLLAVIMVLLFTACTNNSDVSSSEGDNSASSTEKVDEASESGGSSSGYFSSTETASPAQITHITVDEFPAFIGEYVDLGHYDEKKEDDHIRYSKKQEYEKEYETTKGVRLLQSPIILENNTQIYEGMSYADFTAQGWKLVTQVDLNTEIGTNQWLSKALEFEYNGKTIEVYWGNKTDSTIKLSNAAVERFKLSLYDSLEYYLTPIASTTDFMIEDIINSSSELKDIIEVLGEPKSISYSYGKTNSIIGIKYTEHLASTLEFTLSSDGKTIYRVELT